MVTDHQPHFTFENVEAHGSQVSGRSEGPAMASEEQGSGNQACGELAGRVPSCTVYPRALLKMQVLPQDPWGGLRAGISHGLLGFCHCSRMSMGARNCVHLGGHTEERSRSPGAPPSDSEDELMLLAAGVCWAWHPAVEVTGAGPGSIHRARQWTDAWSLGCGGSSLGPFASFCPPFI